MSYLRDRDEPAVDFRERIKRAWEFYVDVWPEFRTRGRRVPANIERVTQYAMALDTLAEFGVVPRREQRLMHGVREGDFKGVEGKKTKRSKKRKRGGAVWIRYARTDYGEREYQRLAVGGWTPEKIADWLARAYMDILPTLPRRVVGRTYLQVGYQISDEFGGSFKAGTRSRTFPVDSTYETLLPKFFQLSVEALRGTGSDVDIDVNNIDPDPDWVVVTYLPPIVGGARAKATPPRKLDDGTIVRDYECSAGTCLVAVANHMGGNEIPRPLKWCREQPDFDRVNGLPMSALNAIEAITGVTLPVVDIVTHELLRAATPGMNEGIGEAIGYDAEMKHFTHIISFAPDSTIESTLYKLNGMSYTLKELIALRQSMMDAWKQKWGRKGSGGGGFDASYKQDISAITQLINKAKKKDEPVKDRRSLLICYDYETVYGRTGETKPYCLSWCCLNMMADDPLADLPKTMVQFDQKVNCAMAGLIVSEHCTLGFLEWLTTSEYVKSFNHVILEAFNGSRFDASFVAELAHSRNKLLPNSLLVVGGGILKGCLSGGFQFHDISRFLCGSLAYNCKAFGVERAKVGGFSHADSQAAENAGTLKEWCRANSKTLREYSAFDVLALAELSWKSYKAFRECPGEPDMFAHPTIASMAYKTLKSELKKRDQALPTPPQTLEDEQLMRGAMYAGRTQMMRGRGTVRGKLYMYDIASSYPYTMLNDQYPSGEYTRTDCEVVGKMGIYRCHIRSQLDGVNEDRPNVTVVPLRDADGEKPLDWTHSGELEATITSVDIEEIRATGNIVDVGEGVYWEDSTLENFRPVLTGLEAIKGNQDRFKREASLQYNPALREASKLFMNSLSGKVAQRMKRKVTVLSSDYATTSDTLDKLKESSVNLSIFGKSMLITGTKVEPFNPKNASPCFLACFIYAYARRRLRSALLCGAWYCDTDSALFDEEGARRFREKYPHWLTPEGQDKKFGEWEEELGQDGTKEFECYMVQPKNYANFRRAHDEMNADGSPREMADDEIAAVDKLRKTLIKEGKFFEDKWPSDKAKLLSTLRAPKIRSKGVGGRDVVITYGQAIKVMAMDEAARGEFCEENKNHTIKTPAVAELVYQAGVRSEPIYALCMQFHRECGAGTETSDQSLGGLFSLRQSYTIKQVGGTATDKSEWESLKQLK